MWILWDVGHLVERLVGNVGFLVLYVISGLFGSIASVYWNPGVNSAGASGAVFGVFGALMGFMLLRGDSVPKSILGRVRSSGLTFLMINLAIGFTIRWIDNAAHIGGLAAGFVCGVLMSHPLERVTSSSRAVRNVLTAAIAAVGVFVALQIAPDAPGDVEGQLADFSKTEKSVLDTMGTAWQRWEDGKMTDDEFAGIVEADVLQPWSEARQELERLNNVQSDQQQLVLKLKEYVRAREEVWEALLVALREPNEERMREYARKNAAADALLEDLNSR
jgi:rhomboid protease GluP